MSARDHVLRHSATAERALAAGADDQDLAAGADHGVAIPDVGVDPLDRTALVRILTEPKNSLVRQFEQMFRLDGVELVFTQDALEAAADLASERETGARGLRSIVENALLDVMYEMPSHKDIIQRVIVDDEAIRGTGRPKIIVKEDGKQLQWRDDGTLESAA